jgi:dihydrofolate synthase/folylpolyglutamate synthase
MTYPEALAYISSLRPRGWRLGLDRMRAFCERANLQEALGGDSGPQILHVAGTNGKGSTTAYLQSLLVERGFQTGAFFSPYVVDPRERIQLNRNLITPEALAEVATELQPFAETETEGCLGEISEFEFKTAIGLRFWQRERCDWVALEVGLGGRLDATNVVQSRAAIVVSIGMDHMHLLGDTLQAIAWEKAGIIKAGVPALIGQMDSSAASVIRLRAKELSAETIEYGADVRWEDGCLTVFDRRIGDVQPGIEGEMQGHNLALAVASMIAAGISMEDDVIRRGAELASIPGRFERRVHRGRKFILDGAHNVDSARVLRKSLDRLEPEGPFAVVTNMLQGHDLSSFYIPLLGRMGEAHVVPIDFHRACPPDRTTTELSRLGVDATEHRSVEDGIAAAIESGLPVLVTGSFYLVGEVITALNRASKGPGEACEPPTS